jgi:hypothetical protein
MTFHTHRRTVTFAEILDEDGTVLSTGEAVLSPDDQDIPSIGRDIAIGRALRNLPKDATIVVRKPQEASEVTIPSFASLEPSLPVLRDRTGQELHVGDEVRHAFNEDINGQSYLHRGYVAHLSRYTGPIGAGGDITVNWYINPVLGVGLSGTLAGNLEKIS